MHPIHIPAYTLTCALGAGLDAIRGAIRNECSGLSPEPWPRCEVETWLGRVPGVDDRSPNVDDRWNCRNNRLARLGIDKDGFIDSVNLALDAFGATRCAVVVGTSTSGIGDTEAGFRELEPGDRFRPEQRLPDVHNPHTTAGFIANLLGLRGPAMTVSTACSSSAKAFASAARLIACDYADAVVVGGVDSLCLTVLNGFHSLQLIDPRPCRPFDLGRAGINLGEAAGFAMLTRTALGNGAVVLSGYGESADAYHMSSAHPDGIGARLSMERAVGRSGLSFEDIGYVNLHGTGTRANDSVEGAVCAAMFPAQTLMSSTKGWTGHALGTAGIVEALLSIDAMHTGVLPGTMNTSNPDPQLGARLLLENTECSVTTVMSNSFGFGGNNCSLVFQRTQP